MTAAKTRGQALKALREKGKVSLDEVADLLPDLSPQDVWRVENGREVPLERYQEIEAAIRTIVDGRAEAVREAVGVA